MPSFAERMHLVPNAILLLCISHAYGATLDARQSQSTTIPAPIAITPDENWDGIDGAWNSFTLRLGTPAQTIRAFVSFASYQTLAVLPQGCQAAEDQNACANARGGLWNSSASTTYESIGLFDFGIEENLGLDGNGYFGYDTVGLGGNGDNGPTLQNTTVGGFAVDDFSYLGIFGVNPKPTNFTSFNEPSTSYMTLLKEQKYIPSVSASYTAGAPYRFTGVLASLTLGGYDTSRFIENDVEFTFAADNSRDLVVAIQSISIPSQIASSPVGTEMLPDPIYAYIDSTVSQLWLPIQACQAFEEEFGLIYDNVTSLYVVNDTLHQSLTQMNPNVTFSLAQGLTGGATVQITLPYGAFDLTAQAGYSGLTNQSYIFPLQRAANETQYTLGRTFLQEAYLTVDWEAQRFNVSAVNWQQNYQQHLVAIAPGIGVESYPGLSGVSTSSKSSSSGLSSGAIAGIAVGAVAVLAILAGLLFWHFRRRSRAAKAAAAEREKMGETGSGGRGTETTVIPKAELEGTPFPFRPTSVGPDNKRLLSPGGSGPPGTPHSLNGASGTLGTPVGPSSSPLGYFGPGSVYSPISGDSGTHDSNNSGSNQSNSGMSAGQQSSSGHGTHSTIISPLTHSSEADSKERPIFEMAGDMPTVKEKDGRQLSEKEAIGYRERVYNGVDSAPTSAIAVDEGVREPRRINPEDVVRADRAPPGEEGSPFYQHRAFSFEDEREDDDSSEDQYR